MQNQTDVVQAVRPFDPARLYERILVPIIDLNEGTHAALLAALDLKRRRGAEVILFCVANADGNDGFLAGTGAEWSLADVCRAGRARLQNLMRTVSPGDEGSVIYDVVGSTETTAGVTEAVNRHHATMVILGIADTGWHLLRSQAERISHAVDCAVLQVHAKTRS